MARRARTILPMLTLAAAACAGCSSPRVSERLVADANVGQYGAPRAALQQRLSNDTSDRSYILDRLRLLILTLADGSPDAAEEVANQTFRLLRTQGLNADRTTSAVVFNVSRPPRSPILSRSLVASTDHRRIGSATAGARPAVLAADIAVPAP